MGNKINERLGLKPQTRARQATHSRALVASVPCPQCGVKGHVRESTIRGVVQRMCDFCVPPFFFAPEEAHG